MLRVGVVVKVSPVIDHSVKGLCTRPYAGHKNGCTNFGSKVGCPPLPYNFEDIFDLTQPDMAIFTVFDLAAHVEKMKAAHPSWSEARLKCCLYWQNGARKKLSAVLSDFLGSNPDYYVTVAFYNGIDKDLQPHLDRVIPSPPEALGVNVTETMKAAGVFLEWPPATVAYQVAMAGKLRKCRVCGCDFFNACPGGCSWVEHDLCSSCTYITRSVLS